jgi:hypothetical protein
MQALSVVVLSCPVRAGTTRLQLEAKGDAGHTYTDFASLVVAFACVGIPIIGWLLDKKVGWGGGGGGRGKSKG